MYKFLADLGFDSVNDSAHDKHPRDTADILNEQREKSPDRYVKFDVRLPRADDRVSGTVIFMAVEPLRSQIRHLEAEKAERRQGTHGPVRNGRLTMTCKRFLGAFLRHDDPQLQLLNTRNQ